MPLNFALNVPERMIIIYEIEIERTSYLFFQQGEYESQEEVLGYKFHLWMIEMI